MNLDKLLADALRHAHNLDRAGARLHQSIECHLIHREVQTKYGPKMWLPRRLIEIIWTDESGQSSSLGLFREMVHSRGFGRRLARVESPGSEVPIPEFVYGEHWVSPRTPVARPTSVHEILELRDRFEELMREVEDAC